MGNAKYVFRERERKNIKAIMKNIETFRYLVLLYAQLYCSVELMDEARSKPFIKGSTKRKLRMAMEELEREIKPFVNKLYEEEEGMIFQRLQVELSKHIHTITETQIEDIVNGNIGTHNEQKETSVSI